MNDPEILRSGPPRHVVRLELPTFNDMGRRRVLAFLNQERLGFGETDAYIYLWFEKSDTRWPEVKQHLKKLTGFEPFVRSEPAFDPGHLRSAQLLHLVKRDRMIWTDWSGRVGLNPASGRSGNLRKDRADFGVVHMKNDMVISARLREIIQAHRLTGWQALPMVYCGQGRKPIALYYLSVTSVLPELAPEAELEAQTDTVAKETSVFQQSPLIYTRSALGRVEDFNLTKEAFGPWPWKHPGLVISHRTWTIFKENGVEPFDVEPVVIKPLA